MSHKILVADHSPAVRNVAGSILRKHGYEVLFAENGADALAAARASKPDIVLLDGCMPDLEGKQLVREFKQDPELEQIAVVVLTSKEQAQEKTELEQTGADALISEPFSPGEILEQVMSLLSQREASPRVEEVTEHKGLYSEEADSTERVERQEVSLSEKNEQAEDGLDIVETSDLMGDLDPSLPGSDEQLAHGFEWFLDELKKETREEQRTAPPTRDRPGLPQHQVPAQEMERGEEGKEHQPDGDQEGFGDFVKDLKWDLERPASEKKPGSESSLVEDTSPHQFDQLLSELKDRVSRRIAQEVAKKISVEFLEKIIREEITEMRKSSS